MRFILNPLLILLLIASTFGYTLVKLTDPSFISQQSRQVNLYGRLTEQVEAILPKDLVDQAHGLSKQDVADIIRTSITADDFYRDFDSLVSAYLNWFTGKADLLAYTIDLTPNKDKAHTAITQKLLAAYDNLPLCQSTQLRTWDATNGLPSCKLPSSNVKSSDVERLFGIQATSFLNNVPDNLTPGQSSTSLLPTRQKVRLVIQAIHYLWLATGALLLLYLLIYRRKSFFSLAIIFLFVGLLQVGFSLIGWDYLYRIASDLISGSGGPQQLTSLALSLLTAILDVLKTILGNISIVTLSLGGLFLLLWVLGKFHRLVPHLQNDD